MAKAQMDFTNEEEDYLTKLKRKFDLKNKEACVKKALSIAKKL